jgi:hypothetical protein
MPQRAPILFHGLNQLGLPVVRVESRQAYQAAQVSLPKKYPARYGLLLLRQKPRAQID